MTLTLHNSSARTRDTIYTLNNIREFSAFSSTARPQAAGNRCRLHMLPSPPATPPPPADRAQCATWPIGESRAEVRCWTATGQLIQCCGHGLLSAAAAWRDNWTDQGELLMNGSFIACEFRGPDIWLGFPRLNTETCTVPHWATTLFGSTPVAAAQAGAADGYLIIAWPQNSDLSALASPGATLAAQTPRAVIATCAVTPEEATFGESIRYRYFAPQHGVDEDSATGSAMRILAAYWQAAGLGHALCAWQQSPRGGWLHSQLASGQAWIGGRVSEAGGNT